MENTDQLNPGRDLSRDSISQATKDTRADLHSAIDKAAEKAQPAADRLASGAHNALDKVSDTASTLSIKASERSKQLGQAAQRFAETGRSAVRSNPAASVAVALAAGYALSKLFGRRH